jgi:hypothetical protein
MPPARPGCHASNEGRADWTDLTEPLDDQTLKAALREAVPSLVADGGRRRTVFTFSTGSPNRSAPGVAFAEPRQLAELLARGHSSYAS